MMKRELKFTRKWIYNVGIPWFIPKTLKIFQCARQCKYYEVQSYSQDLLELKYFSAQVGEKNLYLR